MVYQYYCKLLNKELGESISVIEVVNYSLEKINQSYRLIAKDEEAIFEINDITQMKIISNEK